MYNFFDKISKDHLNVCKWRRKREHFSQKLNLAACNEETHFNVERRHESTDPQSVRIILMFHIIIRDVPLRGLFPRDFIILDRITQHPDFNPWRLARGCKWVRCAILCNRFMHFRKETYEMIGSLISYGMFYIGPKDCWVRSPLCWNSRYLGQ